MTMKRYHVIIFIVLFLNSFINGQNSLLSVHGYLNQAYAISDGYQIFGIPKEGTTDYRNLALQFRYEINARSNFVIQFSHRRVGKNPLMLIDDDVSLDWAFFEYYFFESFSVKVGKIQLPLGNFNELRDVGVLIPFYSVPFSPYGESNYMSETVNGLLLSYESGTNYGWSFNSDLYIGHWTWKEWSPALLSGYGPSVGIINLDNGMGGQFQINTPIEGLEFGFGGQYMNASGGFSFKKGGYFNQGMKILDYYFFIKDDFKDFFFSSDIVKIKISNHSLSPLMLNVLGGVHLLKDFDINVEYDLLRLSSLKIPEFLVNSIGKREKTIDYNNDYAVGFKYWYTYNFVIKAEMHWNNGFLIEDSPINYLIDEAVNTKYFILSVATSF